MTPTGNRPIPPQYGNWWWVIFVFAVVALGYVAIHSGDDSKHHRARAHSSQSSAAAAPSTTVKVDRYVDGDTAKVFYGGASQYVRYIGVDTPETVKEDTPVQCYGKQASAFNRNAIEGKSVRLVFDKEQRDHYGRLLAYVYVDGKLLNAEILAGGYGKTINVPPNTSKSNEFGELQSKAQKERRGLWGACH